MEIDINAGSARSETQRSEANIRASIDNFLVAELDGRVIGCGSLLPMSANIAELRSLAVDAEIRGGGIGARLVARLIGGCER